MRRLPQIDALRGLMLVLMTLTHMPTRFSDPLGQPFGFVSAAEGFVFLSAFLAAYVGIGRAQNAGASGMRQWLRHRLVAVYACHLCLLAFLFLVAVPIGVARGEAAITNLASHFLSAPAWATVQSLALAYNPPLLDILPMYIVFLAMTPTVLAWAQHRGWALILAVSTSLWLLAQVGTGQMLFDVLAYFVGFVYPYNQTGSFSFLAWQFLWVIGLWMGHGFATKPAESHQPPRWVGLIALAYVAVCLVWRHTTGQVPQPHGGEINVLFDKWTLGPMRLLDFLSIAVALLAFAPRIAGGFAPSWLEWLGRAALPAFCAHLVVCLAALALFGAGDATRPIWLDVALLSAGFAAMLLAAGLSASVRMRPRSAAAKHAPSLHGAD